MVRNDRNSLGVSYLARWLVCLWAIFVCGHAFAVDFKGVELGQPLWLSTERAVFGKLNCNPMQLSPTEYHAMIEEMQTTMPGVRKTCSAAASIATVPANVTILLGTSRRVLRITFLFSGSDYTRVVEAMMSKWGGGIVEVRDTNDESIWWDFDDGTTVSAHKMPPGDSSQISAANLPIALVEYSVAVLSPSGDL